MQQTVVPRPPRANQQAIDRDVPDVVRTRRGWYPRWWLLSAYMCCLVIAAGYLLWIADPCLLGGVFASVCSGHPWPDWLQVAAIWAIFGLCWLLAMTFGLGPIEIPSRPQPGQEQQMSNTAAFFRAISEFEPMREILALYGAIAFLGIIVMWLLHHLQPAVFALAAIVIFIAHCSDFHRRTPEQRRSRTLAYAIGFLILAGLTVAISNIPIDWTPGDTHWVVLITECGILLACILSLVLRRPAVQQAIPLTAQEQLQEQIARAATPGYVLRSMWPFNRIFPNRPVR